MIRNSGTGTKRGFTLIELLVVIGMIALITGAMSTSIASAMQRARIQKATSEVKVITQALLAYENYKGELPAALDDRWSDVDVKNVGFLLGTESSGTKDVPVLLQAALSSQGVMRDPWGMPYQVMIHRKKIVSPKVDSITTGYYLPNFYRLTEAERKQ